MIYSIDQKIQENQFLIQFGAASLQYKGSDRCQKFMKVRARVFKMNKCFVLVFAFLALWQICGCDATVEHNKQYLR